MDLRADLLRLGLLLADHVAMRLEVVFRELEGGVHPRKAGRLLRLALRDVPGFALQVTDSGVRVLKFNQRLYHVHRSVPSWSCQKTERVFYRILGHPSIPSAQTFFQRGGAETSIVV